MAKIYKKKINRSKARWAPNITKIRDVITCSSGEWGANSTLTTNPVQSNALVSQVYTVKNFEISFTIDGVNMAMGYIEGVTAYIMFVPQGMSVGNDYYSQHPEYILNYKYLGSPTSLNAETANEIQNFQPIRVKTRLSRKLQTGDQIVLFLNGVNTSTSNQTINIDGIVRWWTKAN